MQFPALKSTVQWLLAPPQLSHCPHNQHWTVSTRVRSLPQPSQPRAATSLFSVSLGSPLGAGHPRGLRPRGRCAWPLAHTVLARCIRVVARARASFPFLAESESITRLFHTLSIPQLIQHLGRFHFCLLFTMLLGAVDTSAARAFQIRAPCGPVFSVPLGVCLAGGLPAAWQPCSTTGRASRLLSKAVKPLCTPSGSEWGLPFLYILAAPCCVPASSLSPCVESEVVSRFPDG